MNKYIDRIEHTFDGNLQVEENVSFYRRKKEENSKKMIELEKNNLMLISYGISLPYPSEMN